MKLQNWQRSFNVSHNTTDTFLNDKYLNWFVKLMYAFTFLNASPEQSYNQWLNCCAVSWSLWIKKPSGKREVLKDLILPDKEKNIFYFDFCCSFCISKVKSYMKYYSRETWSGSVKWKRDSKSVFVQTHLNVFVLTWLRWIVSMEFGNMEVASIF